MQLVRELHSKPRSDNLPFTLKNETPKTGKQNNYLFLFTKSNNRISISIKLEEMKFLYRSIVTQDQNRHFRTFMHRFFQNPSFHPQSYPQAITVYGALSNAIVAEPLAL
jgi:hypothetical protein